MENAHPIDDTEIICNLRDVKLEHCIYDPSHDTWIKKSSAPQPTLGLYETHYPCDTRALGLQTPLTRPTKAALVSVSGRYRLPIVSGRDEPTIQTWTRFVTPKQDTSADDSRQREQLGHNRRNPSAPVRLRFSGGTETRQIVYICRDTSDFFLSRGACVEIGIVPPDFPNGCQKRQSTAEVSACNVASESSMTATCDCPRRQPPQLPTKYLPFPAVEDNREKLEQWLFSYYKASTFSTCHHQQLLPLEGPPLRLMIHPDAKPVACHTPIDVPIHWRDDVKAGLDQDCKMGVIEVVPVGTPVTWCHRIWLYVQRRTASLGGRCICRHLTLTPTGILTTHRDTSTKRDRYCRERRRRCVTLGMAAMPSDSTLTTNTSRRS